MSTIQNKTFAICKITKHYFKPNIRCSRLHPILLGDEKKQFDSLCSNPVVKPRVIRLVDIKAHMNKFLLDSKNLSTVDFKQDAIIYLDSIKDTLNNILTSLETSVDETSTKKLALCLKPICVDEKKCKYLHSSIRTEEYEKLREKKKQIIESNREKIEAALVNRPKGTFSDNRSAFTSVVSEVVHKEIEHLCEIRIKILNTDQLREIDNQRQESFRSFERILVKLNGD